MKKFDRILEIDRENSLVICQSGCTLKKLNTTLESEGLGLRVLGSISEQTIAGSISTGTHGTGHQYGIFANDVVALQFVNGSGEIIECNEMQNLDIFKACLCSLGVLGIITQVTIRVEPLRYLETLQYPLSLKEIEMNFEVTSSAEHVRFWWFPHTEKCSIWKANKIDRPVIQPKQLWFNQLRSLIFKWLIHHILELAFYLTTFVPRLLPYVNQLSQRLLYNKTIKSQEVSYKAFNFDCLFKQYVNEWAVPVDKTMEALRLLRKLINTYQLKVHWPVEVRFVRGDDILLSPCYGGDRCFIGIIMYRPYGKNVPYLEYFRAFENMMTELGGRPHWAKAHHWKGYDCRKSYPMWDKFGEIKMAMDPHKLFTNSYIKNMFDT